MTFAPDAILRILQVAYGSHPWADVVGGYCPLRGDLALPTIDTGTGTWESHFPGGGVVEVMRTGAAFLLVKRHVLTAIPAPWFATRLPWRVVDAFMEIDNFARIKCHGTNPLRTSEWQRLEALAGAETPALPYIPLEVGEDSGFCDRAKAAGFRIVVDTNTVTGHLSHEVVTWERHKAAIDSRRRDQRYLVGLLA